jgi:outer membrane protein OmpA-like peptidoglycan-associated protein
LKPRHYASLIDLAKQVRDTAGPVGGLMLLIEGYADDTGARLMNSGLSFNRALEVKKFLTEVIAHISNNKISVHVRLSGKGEKSPTYQRSKIEKSACGGAPFKPLRPIVREKAHDFIRVHMTNRLALRPT